MSTAEPPVAYWLRRSWLYFFFLCPANPLPMYDAVQWSTRSGCLSCALLLACRSVLPPVSLPSFARFANPTPSLPSSWANLRALQRLVAKEEMALEVNVRERQVSGMKTIQLETCGASAIQCFDKVGAAPCVAQASERWSD